MNQLADEYQEWGDVAIALSVPHTQNERTHKNTLTIQGSTFVELPYSGWGALVGWLSGAHRMMRTPVELPQPSLEDAGYDDSAADREEIDNEIDFYLSEADVPARPRGYRWFLKLPQGVDGRAFWSKLMQGISDRGLTSPYPGDWKEALEGLLDEIHGDN
ncbi:DUF5956 family protein [Kibdelosporangium lantanae]|uniref:DUF5956 family protein n=1 Tax=Kibdelosporangium lantanae TaxID=1497396 RepID=A0ABW3M0Q3_9PSEU